MTGTEASASDPPAEPAAIDVCLDRTEIAIAVDALWLFAIEHEVLGDLATDPTEKADAARAKAQTDELRARFEQLLSAP